MWAKIFVGYAGASRRPPTRNFSTSSTPYLLFFFLPSSVSPPNSLGNLSLKRNPASKRNLLQSKEIHNLRIFLYVFLAWKIALETTPTAPRLQQYCSITDFGATFRTTITQLKARIPQLPPGPVTQFTTVTTKIKAHEQV